ncbi:MAG TPA: hypothetical protein VH107_02440 [Lacipirellulaceae bacterium]|jgi:hypothetical protein|nr:hypothetical protein [Lacipirellulaceae bacterium]
MKYEEQLLYHQIHPGKLAADIAGSIVSTYLVWQHHFWWAMLCAFAPALLGSALVLRFANLEPFKQSRMGRYINRFMNHWIEAWRFTGQIVMWVGAWYHAGWMIFAGALVVIVAWSFGLCVPNPTPKADV